MDTKSYTDIPYSNKTTNKLMCLVNANIGIHAGLKVIGSLINHNQSTLGLEAAWSVNDDQAGGKNELTHIAITTILRHRKCTLFALQHAHNTDRALTFAERMHFTKHTIHTQHKRQ